MALLETMLGGVLVCGLMAAGAGTLYAGDYIREHYGDGTMRRTRLTPVQHHMARRDLDIRRIKREDEKRERLQRALEAEKKLTVGDGHH